MFTQELNQKPSSCGICWGMPNFPGTGDDIDLLETDPFVA
jgi:hypothetical protein